MNNPTTLLYSQHHLWVLMEGETAAVGITDFAQKALGDIVFIGLPQVGEHVIAGEIFGDIESVKTASDLISPVSGTIAEVNEALTDTPDDLNLSPYGHWVIKVSGLSTPKALMDAAEYEIFCST